MAEPDDSAFSHVLSAFRSRLSPQDMDVFRSTTFDHLKQAIVDIQTEQAQRRGLRNLNKIRPFLNGLAQYAQVIEVFVNAKPDILAFVWGPIKLCLQIASRLTEAFDALLDAYEKIGKSFPIFSMIDRLFRSKAHVQQVLVDVYEDILDFHKRAIVFFKQSAWRLAFKVTIHTFGDMFGDVIKKLERSKLLLLQSANVEHFQEAQEARLIFSREIEALAERTKKDRMLTVIDWLSPTSCCGDHEELQEKRREFPNTTRWIFRESCMHDWLRFDQGAKPMFWLCGIPGAGKTILFSSVVDEIRLTMPDSQVVYFYCKNRDPSKRSFDAVARSLIAQILQLNPVSLDYLHETAVRSGEQHPSTFKSYQDILENISITHNLLFIGVDGLDECEEADRRLILSLMEHVLRISKAQANVKIFFASQRIKDVQESLKFAIRLDVKHHHVKQDIQNYVHARSAQLCKKFRYGFEKQKSLVREISSKPNGMFLLARLIMDNLMSQDSIEDLEEELSTDTLPNGISEAYGRIFVRLRKGRTEKSHQRIKRVLEIILTAQRPMRVEEVQGALSVHVLDMSVDFMKRRSMTSFNELCGPLVEVHADDVVSLVHPTAKQYLTQYHTGPYIDILTAEVRMANLCTSYLTLEFFSTSLPKTTLQDRVAAGTFAFQEYATLNWLYHIECSSSPNIGDANGELASLHRACQLLKSRHRETSFSHQGTSSASDDGYCKPISKPDLVHLRSCYGAVLSISDDDEYYDTLPYLLQLLARVRSIIEALSLAECDQSTSLNEAYGACLFRCSILACPRFLHGFICKKLRDEHQKTHRSRFNCTQDGCDYSILGFSTERELAQHLIEHESQRSEIHFPRVQRASLTKSLEQAIDQNDILSVKSLSTEVSFLPSRYTGFILRAAKKGKFKSLRALISTLGTEEDLNFRGNSGEVALHYIVENGDEEMTQLIIQKGADLNVESRRPGGAKDTPLMIAAARGHSRIVKLLSDQGGRGLELDLAWPGSHETPLQLAAKGGYVEILEMILDIDGVAYAQHGAYSKAISLAVSNGHESSVKMLLEKGHNLNAEQKYRQALRGLIPKGIEAMVAHLMHSTDGRGANNGNRLQVAASNGKTNEVHRLLEAGTNINYGSSTYGTALAAAAKSGSIEVVRLLLNKGSKINAEGKQGTALQQAVCEGHEAVVKLLLENKADVNVICGKHRSALAAAASGGYLSLVQLLLNNGASINSIDNEGRTALQEAAHNGHEAVIKLLLENGADSNVSSLRNDTALMAAVRGGYWMIVQHLLNNGANVNAANGLRNETALQRGACISHEAFVKLLLENGADVNAFVSHGTALHLAVGYGHEEIVRRLLNEKADCNISCSVLLKGRRCPSVTPCKLAAGLGHEKILSLLLQHGADPNGGTGESALQIAKHCGHQGIVDLLYENGARLDELCFGAINNGYGLETFDFDAILRSTDERALDLDLSTSKSDSSVSEGVEYQHL